MSTITTIKASRYQYRYLARFIVEAVTPLAIGSGETDLLTDAPVAVDVNGLPYIPGTALAGVIRHQLEEKSADVAVEWGTSSTKASSDSCGSNFMITEARILNADGQVMDGMNMSATEDSLLQHYTILPIRQHARINEKGTVTDVGKFDEQVVYAGTRFCFELEWLAATPNNELWNSVLAEFLLPSFRVGSGTRSGFGDLKVVDTVQVSQLDLKDQADRSLYLQKSSELQQSGAWRGWKPLDSQAQASLDLWKIYQLTLSPQDLFLFSAAGGDAEGNADTTAVKAKKVFWQNGKGVLAEDMVLIPATSVKGTIAHRVAFHYNRLNKYTVEQLSTTTERSWSEQIQLHTGKNNPAVCALFGSEGEKINGSLQNKKRGNTIFSDLILNPEGYADKLVNHVTIDDFTGAAIDGHLFTEKPLYGKGQTFTMTILVKASALVDSLVQQAFECTLTDLCEGALPLGGGVNRGNGIFCGTWNKTEA